MTTSSTTPRVTVLGTGRMGAAIATRLAASFDVTTWSRSGRRVAAVPDSPSLTVAVKDADLVLLALFDAAACVEVLAACLAALRPGATVVNTSTVAPADAEELVRRVESAGHRYLHAPVLGSTPAVAAGRVTVLAGGPVDAAARSVLADLGELVLLPDPGSAAALKLLANGALADCLLAVRAGLVRGHAAGLDTSSVLSVLARSQLGGLVSAKRDRLEGLVAGRAEFAVDALDKDLALLRAVSGTGHPASELIESLRAHHALVGDDDVAALCTRLPEAASARRWYADARLEVAAEVRAPADVLAPLHRYARGHATGDPEHFRQAFLPSAHVEGLRDGAFVSWDLADYCAHFAGPAPDESQRRRRVEHVRVDGTVASAAMSLWHGPDRFTDLFLLVCTPTGWRIANKAYHRAAAA